MQTFDIFKNLVKETFLFRTFKRMSPLMAVLSVIALSPFILLYAISLLFYGVYIVLFKVANTMADYLLLFVKREGQEVKHATQAIIYFIAFPFIFFLKILISILVFFIVVIHMGTSLIGYVATLGGITFSPFLLEPVNRLSEREIKPYNSIGTIVFVSIAIILFITFLVFIIIYAAAPEFYTYYEYVYDYYGGYQQVYNYYYNYNRVIYFSLATSFLSVEAIFVAIYSVVFFRSKPIVTEDNQATEITSIKTDEKIKTLT